MPAFDPPRAHLPQSDPRCDTVTVLNMAARCRPGHRFADMNAVGIWNLHWPEGPELNHFTHRMVKGHLERMPVALRRRAVLSWPESEVLTWRKNVGTARRPKWVRPFTVGERQAQARRRFVVITWELKAREFASLSLARRFTEMVNAAGGRWCVFTLAVMAEWEGKLRAFHSLGVGTALSVNGAARANYRRTYIDRIWGTTR